MPEISFYKKFFVYIKLKLTQNNDEFHIFRLPMEILVGLFCSSKLEGRSSGFEKANLGRKEKEFH